jgi:hypothetical protein
MGFERAGVSSIALHFSSLRGATRRSNPCCTVFRHGLLRCARNDNIKTLFTTRLSMSPLTITAKGQVTLRKDLLKHLGVRPGEKIAVLKLAGGRIEMRAARPTGKISDAFGFLKRKGGPSLSIAAINKIAARGWAGKR